MLIKFCCKMVSLLLLCYTYSRVCVQKNESKEIHKAHKWLSDRKYQEFHFTCIQTNREYETQFKMIFFIKCRAREKLISRSKFIANHHAQLTKEKRFPMQMIVVYWKWKMFPRKTWKSLGVCQNNAWVIALHESTRSRSHVHSVVISPTNAFHYKLHTNKLFFFFAYHCAQADFIA